MPIRLRTTFEGDGEIIARVAHGPAYINDLTKAGVMIRGDLSAGAANVSVFVTAARGTVLQSAPVTAGGDCGIKQPRSDNGGDERGPPWPSEEPDLSRVCTRCRFDVEGVTRWGFSTGCHDRPRHRRGNIHIYMSGAELGCRLE